MLFFQFKKVSGITKSVARVARSNQIVLFCAGMELLMHTTRSAEIFIEILGDTE